jgi:hypothetical protein
MTWTKEKAWEWYRPKGWLVGCNYFPASACNPIEMWQGDTFDPAGIDRELGLAEGLGFNTVRTNLHFLVWELDGEAQKRRLDQFLAIATRHNISTMVCLFDDCCHSWKQPWTGKQDEPRPGVHNSCWTPSPGHVFIEDRAAWPRLRKYVEDIVGSFAHDPRVLCWDIYNEPGNWDGREKSLPLLEASFGWVRAINPDAPLTSGVWHSELKAINSFLVGNSDVVSFHDYMPLEDTRRQIAELAPAGRPLMCTEYMARLKGSFFATHLPVFKEAGIAAYNWGLVNGRTQTQFPWDSKPGSPDPEPWFHDIFRNDLTPYREEEVELIRKLAGKKS